MDTHTVRHFNHYGTVFESLLCESLFVTKVPIIENTKFDGLLECYADYTNAEIVFHLC